MSKGWYGNKVGHSLASKGIRTKLQQKMDIYIKAELDYETERTLKLIKDNSELPETYIDSVFIIDNRLKDNLLRSLKENTELYNIKSITKFGHIGFVITLYNNRNISFDYKYGIYTNPKSEVYKTSDKLR